MTIDTRTPADILIDFNTDKATHHSYGHIYNELFTDIRHDVSYVLELGIFHGESLKAWRKIFPNALIVGMDNELQAVEEAYQIDDREILPAFGDATNPQDIAFLIESVLQPFDVIIDDASHIPEEQFKSLFLLWPHLRPGGIYVIEDIYSNFLHLWEPLPCVVYEGNQMIIADNLAYFIKPDV